MLLLAGKGLVISGSAASLTAGWGWGLACLYFQKQFFKKKEACSYEGGTPMSTPSHPGLGDLQPVPASPRCSRDTPGWLFPWEHYEQPPSRLVFQPCWLFFLVHFQFVPCTGALLPPQRFRGHFGLAGRCWAPSSPVPQVRCWGPRLAYTEGRPQAFCHLYHFILFLNVD